jgi:hypothetical protein
MQKQKIPTARRGGFGCESFCMDKFWLLPSAKSYRNGEWQTPVIAIQCHPVPSLVYLSQNGNGMGLVKNSRPTSGWVWNATDPISERVFLTVGETGSGTPFSPLRLTPLSVTVWNPYVIETSGNTDSSPQLGTVLHAEH